MSEYRSSFSASSSPAASQSGGAVRRRAGRPPAAPYQHGKAWCMRRRYQGHDLFVSGQPTAAAAQRAMTALVHQVDENAKPVGAGASRTILAQAMQDYALERLPFLKGAAQEARRINVYLRAAGLSLLQVKKLDRLADVGGRTGKGAYFAVELIAHSAERVIPQGLHAHRRALLSASARTDRLRAALATTPIGAISRDQVQALVDRMHADKHSASTVSLERSVLRVVFNHAYTQWGWMELRDNPATRLKMPAIDNERNRVLSIDEQALLDEALASCRNEMVAPTLTLLRETAMRASEPLEQACWGDVDWERGIIALRDAKAGKRDVPLSPAALDALRALNPGADHEPIVRISYESVRAAWRRACDRAGITDIRLHDLRHTAATRMALKTGNVFLVKALTGHKTIKMLERYVNVTADDVVRAMREVPETDGLGSSNSAAAASAKEAAAQPVGRSLADAGASGKVIQFPQRKVA